MLKVLLRKGAMLGHIDLYNLRVDEQIIQHFQVGKHLYARTTKRT